MPIGGAVTDCKEPATALEFNNREAASGAAVARLSLGGGVAKEVLSEVIDHLDIVEEIEAIAEQRSPGGSGACFGRFRYVIRNDDIVTLGSFLELLKATSELTVGIITVHMSGTTPGGVKEVIDGLVGLFRVVKDTIAKGTVLSPEDFAVIAALRKLGASTAVKIAESLTIACDGRRTFDADDIEVALSQYRVGNGKALGFIIRDADGTWSLKGV
jgi:hypothetical protein